MMQNNTAVALMVDKNDLVKLGFSASYSATLIRMAKHLMVKKGYGLYESRKLGKVPAYAVEEILGVSLDGVRDAQSV